MTLIDKIVHYMFLILIGPVFILVYLGSNVAKKNNTFLHNIHPGPFDPYGCSAGWAREELRSSGAQE